jgi:hypothetical protein
VKIRIVDVPPGEAPLEVRQRWVGLVLPLVEGDAGPVKMLAQGVLTGPRVPAGRWKYWWYRLTGRVFVEAGYRVPAIEAVELLAAHAPEAASWWRTNTPHLFAPQKVLVFSPAVCESISSPARS